MGTAIKERHTKEISNLPQQCSNTVAIFLKLLLSYHYNLCLF